MFVSDNIFNRVLHGTFGLNLKTKLSQTTILNGPLELFAVSSSFECCSKKKGKVSYIGKMEKYVLNIR